MEDDPQRAAFMEEKSNEVTDGKVATITDKENLARSIFKEKSTKWTSNTRIIKIKSAPNVA